MTQRNYNHSLFSNAPHVIYDNKSSRDFNIMNVQTTSGLVEEVFLANTTLVTDKSRYNERVYLLGVEREPLSFTLRFLFNPHTFNERNYQEIKEWLYQNTYKPFKFDTGKEDSLDVYVYAIITGESKGYHNAINDGYIDFTFTTNSPYRYSPIMEDEFDFTRTNSEKMRDSMHNGAMETRRNISELTSKLRQLSAKSNFTFKDYKEAVDSELMVAYDYMNTLKTTFEYLKNSNNYTGSLYAKYSQLQTRFNNLIDKLHYDKNTSVNEYSKRLAVREQRLDENDELVNATGYITSDYIEVYPNLKYVWYSARVGTKIVNPRVNFYNGKKELVDSQTFEDDNVIHIEYPNNVGYIKVSGRTITHDDKYWQVNAGQITNYQEHSYDSYKVLTQREILDVIDDFNVLSRDIISLADESEVYILSKTSDINDTLEIFPNYVDIYNFGQLPCKPRIEITMSQPSDVKIVNLNTNESTTIENNMAGEVIVLKNETEQIETSRTKIDRKYYKYNDHDDNFITLSQFHNHLEIYGNCKIKFIYQFKIL